MKFIEPSVEYWRQESGLKGVWNQIAKATRVCYQSSVREGESSEDFVKRVILKPALIEGNLDDLEHCKFDFDKMHGAMLEHGTVYLDIDSDLKSLHELFVENPYSRVTYDNSIIKDHFFVTTNMRVIIENNLFGLLEDWMIDTPTEHHAKRYTFSVITDIGVTREMNRHRTFSVAEQSTRYCDLTKDKFDNSLSFPLPSWVNKDLLDTSKLDNNNELVCMSGDLYFTNTKDISKYGVKFDYTNNWDTIDFYIYVNIVAQYCYQALRHRGWRPEQARQVLPLGLKTQAVYTAFSDDWEHFLRLRADNISGKAHPNIQLVAKKIQDIINTL